MSGCTISGSAGPVGFCAPVTVVDPPPAVASSKRSLSRLALPAAVLVVVAAMIGIYQFYVPSRYVPPRTGAALAVVPFQCGSPGGYWCDAWNEALVTEVARIDGVRVTAREGTRTCTFESGGVSPAVRLLAGDGMPRYRVMR